MTGFDAALRAHEAYEVQSRETDTGTSVLYRVGSDLVVSRARGHIDAPHIRNLTSYCDRLFLTLPTISVFHDWFGVDTYETESRKAMTPWAARTRDRHCGIHIGVTSRVVRMGISVVAMATDNPVHTYATLGELSAALDNVYRASGK